MEKTAIVFSLNFNFHVFLIFLYVFITFFTAKSHIFSRFYIKKRELLFLTTFISIR